jgi:hypothetical protein
LNRKQVEVIAICFFAKRASLRFFAVIFGREVDYHVEADVYLLFASFSFLLVKEVFRIHINEASFNFLCLRPLNYSVAF